MNSRQAKLAKIHIAKKALAITDDEYRAILEAKFGVESSKKLKLPQLEQLVGHFQALGWEPAPAKKAKSKPRNMGKGGRAPLLSKIEAFLAEAGRSWEYADGIAKRVCKVDKVQWCKPEQLKKVVAALAYDAKRHGRRV
jgi:phage gp16-like protein